MIEVGLFLQVVFFLLVVLVFLASPNASFFHPMVIYLLFHFLVFVLRPLMVYAFGFDNMWRYMEFAPTDDDFVQTLWVSSIALLVFSVTAIYAGRASTSFSTRELPLWNAAEKRAYNIVLALFAPLGIYSAIFAQEGESFSGEGNIQMTRDLATGVAVYTNTTGYIAQAHSVMGALFLLLLWRFNFRLWAYVPFALFIAYRAYLGWGRWAMVVSIMTLIFIYMYRNKHRWPKLRYVLLLVPMIVLFQNLGMNRDLVRDLVESNETVLAEAPVYLDQGNFVDELDHPDFANFEFLAYVLNVVPEKSQTYTYFTQYLQLFTEPIPRIIWKEKPIGAPVQLINLNDYGNFVGMTTSLAGDGWMSLGWLGMILTMALTGLGLGALHRWFWRNQDSPKVIMMYFVLLPLWISWFRDGGIGIAKLALFTLAPILAWTWLSKFFMTLENRPEAQRSITRGRRF